MGRPPLGSQPMSKAKIQARWRQRKREREAAEAEAAEAAKAAKAQTAQAARAAAQTAVEREARAAANSFIRSEPQGLEPIVRPYHNEYADVVRAVIEFVDGLPQPQVHLVEIIRALRREYEWRQRN